MKLTKWPFLGLDGCAWPKTKNDPIPEDSIRQAWQELAELLGSKLGRNIFDSNVVGPAELRYLEVFAISKGWGKAASSVLKEQRDFKLGHAVDILLARGVSSVAEASKLLAFHYDQNVRPGTIRKAHDWCRRLSNDPDAIPGEVTNLSGNEAIALAERALPNIDFEKKADDVRE